MSKTITVSTLAELKSALSGATGGETILLQGGDYGKLGLSSMDFPSTVTIASANPEDPAVFSGLSLKNVSDLTFDGVVFDYAFSPDDASTFRPFNIEKSDNVTIRNSTFDGDLADGRSAIDDGYGAGFGLSVRNGSNITVENNEFYSFYRGAVFTDISGLTVSGNDLHGMSSDGMDFVDTQRVLIEGNFLHDFQRSSESTAHPDMIQFWTNGTTEPSGDIVIRGNRLDIGEGAWTQSIFMRNEMVDSYGAGAEMFYYNVLIEDNVIVNGHLHGITVGASDGLTIRNNTLVHADGRDVDGADAGIEIPAIRVATNATDVTITDNIAVGVNGYDGQPGWTVEGNLLLAPDSYESAFITSTMTPNGGIHDFRALPGGPVDLSAAGAAETHATPAALTAQFNATPVDQSLSTWIFDATAALNGGSEFPPGTVFLWTFGDGTQSSGQIVSHSYAEAGRHQAELTIRLPNGHTAGALQEVMTEGYEILHMERGTGFTAYELGVESTLAVAAVGRQGLVIGAPGTVASVGRGNVSELIGSDSFGIDLSLKAASAASSGEVFRLHGSLVASINADGEFYLNLSTAAGTVKVMTAGAGLNDTRLHDIHIDYADDRISISVDDKVLASVAMPEPMVGGGQDLTFGNPWNKPNFAGLITEFTIDRGDAHLPDTTETFVLDASYTQGDVVPAPVEPIVPMEPIDPVPPVPPVDHPHLSPEPILLDLGDSGVARSVNRSEVAGMLRNDTFHVALGLQSDGADSRGEVFRIHGSIVTSVTASGEFQVLAFTSAGQVKLTTSGAGLDDLDHHKIGFSLENGVLSISIDGALNASTEMSGTLLSEGRHDLTFGNPWGKTNFDGALTDFDLTFPTVDDHGQRIWASVGLETDVARPEKCTPGQAPGPELFLAGPAEAAAPILTADASSPESADTTDSAPRPYNLLFSAGVLTDEMPDAEHLMNLDRFAFFVDPGADVPHV
jgi:parallel beta-helix repeat protein